MPESAIARKYVQRAADSRFQLYWRWQFTIVLLITSVVMMVVDVSVIWDYFRIVAIAMGIWILLFSVKVIRVYTALQIALKKRESNHHLTRTEKIVNLVASPRNLSTKALLPAHIRWVVVSYSLLIVASCSWMIERLGHGPHPWGLPFIVVAHATGLYALGFLWRFELRTAAEAGVWSQRKKSR